MVSIENITLSSEFSKKNPKPGLRNFDLKISCNDKFIIYNFYANDNFINEDIDGFDEPKLSEDGMYVGLLCFVSEALENINHMKSKASYLGLVKFDLEWIEDVIIRKRMKFYKKLRTNI